MTVAYAATLVSVQLTMTIASKPDLHWWCGGLLLLILSLPLLEDHMTQWIAVCVCAFYY